MAFGIALTLDATLDTGVRFVLGCLTSSRQTRIRVGVHEQLHLEEVSDLLRIEHQDALEQHHVSRVHGHRLFLPAAQTTKHRNTRVPRDIGSTQECYGLSLSKETFVTFSFKGHNTL